MLYRTDPTAERDPDHDRQPDVALRSVMHLGDLRHDLVERWIHEAVELDFTHRPVPPDGQADRGADDAGLGKGRVDDALFTEVLLQAVGDTKDAPQLADVFTHDEYLVV